MNTPPTTLGGGGGDRLASDPRRRARSTGSASTQSHQGCLSDMSAMLDRHADTLKRHILARASASEDRRGGRLPSRRLRRHGHVTATRSWSTGANRPGSRGSLGRRAGGAARAPRRLDASSRRRRVEGSLGSRLRGRPVARPTRRGRRHPRRDIVARAGVRRARSWKPRPASAFRGRSPTSASSAAGEAFAMERVDGETIGRRDRLAILRRASRTQAADELAKIHDPPERLPS